MKNYLSFLLFLFLFSACSQKEFSFRKKIPVNTEQASKPVKPRNDIPDHKKSVNIPEELSDTDSTKHAIAPPEQKDHKKNDRILSAEARLRQILPFDLLHLSPEEKELPDQNKINPKADHDSGPGVMAMIFGIMAFLLLMLAGVFELGILIALSIVLGILSFSFGLSGTIHHGDVFSIIALILGSLYMLFLLLVLFVIFMFLTGGYGY